MVIWCDSLGYEAEIILYIFEIQKGCTLTVNYSMYNKKYRYIWVSKNISDLSVCSRSAMFSMIRESSNFSSPSFQISRNLHSRGIHNTRVRINEFIVASWKLVALNENTEGAPRSTIFLVRQLSEFDNTILLFGKQNKTFKSQPSFRPQTIVFSVIFFFIYFSYHCTCNINSLIFVLNHIAHKLQQADLPTCKKKITFTQMRWPG